MPTELVLETLPIQDLPDPSAHVGGDQDITSPQWPLHHRHSGSAPVLNVGLIIITQVLLIIHVLSSLILL